MSSPSHTTHLRVRYSETDQMGTVYNSRVLEWFECARTEALRAIHLPYRELESKGILLPVIESHVRYTGRATYDDELVVTTSIEMSGRARIRFNESVHHADTGRQVATGYTVHAITNASGRAIRPPAFLLQTIDSTSGVINGRQ